MKFPLFGFVLLIFILVLQACGSTGDGPGRKVHRHEIFDATVRDEPKSKQGNPEFYTVMGKRYFVLSSSRGYRKKGIASWYGKKFHGRKTSNGETYDMYKMTAAHKTLPLPTYVEVRNLENGKRAIVRVNDRGPFHDNRIIDLSYSAALKLDIVKNGTGMVEVRAIDPKNQRRSASNSESVQQTAPQVKELQNEKRFYNRIFIQIGAFSEKQNAIKLMDKLLENRLFHVNVIPGNNDNGDIIHRVRIGPLHTIKNTDSAVAALQVLGYTDYQIHMD